MKTYRSYNVLGREVSIRIPDISYTVGTLVDGGDMYYNVSNEDCQAQYSGLAAVMQTPEGARYCAVTFERN